MLVTIVEGLPCFECFSPEPFHRFFGDCAEIMSPLPEVSGPSEHELHRLHALRRDKQSPCHVCDCVCVCVEGTLLVSSLS